MPAKISPQSVSRRSESSVASDQPKSDPNLARHARKCAICNHPDREFIEEDFVAWRSEAFLCRVYTLPSPSSIYRHASATGLLARRRRNLRGVAERIMENVNGATVTASAVLRAMRIFASITEDGQWADVPRRSVVTHIHTHAPSSASSLDPAPPASPSNDHAPNCHSERVPTPFVGATRNLHFNKPSARTECATQPRTASTHWTPSAADRPSTAVEAPPTSPVAPSCHSEPAELRPCEEPAVPAARSDASSVETPASPSVPNRPTDEQQNRKTPLQLDYLPRWAAGLRDAEILIGVENSSPGDSTD